MRRRRGGFRRWKAFWGRGGFIGQRQPRLEPARRLEAAGEPAAALTDAIAAHERLLGRLVAVTAAERAVLQELYQSAGLDERMGAFPLAPTGPGGSADRSVEVRADLGISGLDDRRLTVLEQKLGITSCYELIMADRRRIADAFGRRTIRPTLEEVAVWQDEARHVRAASIEAAISEAAASGWEPTATFVVAFEERRRGDAPERRIVAELTEVEPEASLQQRSEWPGWACDDACRWMLGRVGVPAAPAPPVPAQITAVAEAGAADTRAAETRSQINVERANLADSSGHIELVADSRPVPQGRLVWVQPARLLVTLGGALAAPGTSVVLQLVQAGGQSTVSPGISTKRAVGLRSS